MRIAILAPGYPRPGAPDEYAFVHARALLYRAWGHEVAVFVPRPATEFAMDGVPVSWAPARELADRIRRFRPDALAHHAPNFRTIPAARRVDCRQVSWLHGHEVLFSLRRVHYVSGPWARLFKLAKLLPLNFYQLALARGFLPSQDRLVFVSDWMRRAAERHTRRQYPKAVVIPNPVDTELFSYRLDPANLRRGVAARSFNSTKYGLDLAIRAFAGLTAADLTIVGSGPLADRFARLIAETGANAELQARRIPHDGMPALFGAYGFFLAPSRVEAQGVAMCEAMACGLPVIATRIGGIPEFVEHGVEGLLVPPEDPPAIRAAVEALVSDPSRQLEMSRRARARVEAQCGPATVTRRELAVLAGEGDA